jgi:hypothetical protein
MVVISLIWKYFYAACIAVATRFLRYDLLRFLTGASSGLFVSDHGVDTKGLCMVQATAAAKPKPRGARRK